MQDVKRLSPEKQELVNEIIKLMEKENLTLKKMWRNLSAPNNPITEKEYKGSNNIRLLLSSVKQGFEDPRWMTYTQAKQNKLQVKKGEKATSVYYYQLTDKKTGKNFNPETIKSMQEEEKNDYLKKNVYFLTKKYNVFNGEQIDGIEKYKKNTQIDLSKRNEILEKILNDSEAKIHYDQTDKAFYNLKKDEIHLPERESFNNIESLYSVALHEMAHSTGHEKRLNRDMTGVFGDKEYAKEELIAEFSSIFMQQETNLKIDDKQLENNAAYIKSWNSVLKENPEFLFEAIKEAQKVNNYILEPYRKELENIKEKEERKELKGLKVTLHWSEAIKGEDLVYEGKEAYKFLEKMRDMDKKQFNKISKLLDENGKLPSDFEGLSYYKTKITFEENGIKKTERIDIGDGLFSKEKISKNLLNYNIRSEEISKYEKKIGEKDTKKINFKRKNNNELER